MSQQTLTNPSRDITGEACAWIAQLETGELTAADREAFREWMQRSPRHVSEIKRLAAWSAKLNVLTEMAEPIEQAAAHYAPVFKRRQRQRPWGLMLAAAVVVLALVGVTFRGVLLSPRVELQQASFTTAHGEQRNIELVDATVVTLNTESTLRVNYTPEARRVELVKGEAYFEVAHNTERPFLVEANGRQVRAVGTAFAVKVLDNDFSVTVVEGKVELTGIETESLRPDGSVGRDETPQAKPTSQKTVFLKAGESITLAPVVKAVKVIEQTPREQQRAVAWQQGLHDFSDTPLEDVIHEINRYSTLEIEIDDPTLRQLKFGGIFRIGDTQQLLDALENSYGIDVERIGPNTVRLRRRHDANSG